MNAPEVIQAYREKYAKFPDLVQRIVSQFDYKWWNPESGIDISNFRAWKNTVEGFDFWNKVAYLEEFGLLNKKSLNAAYKEFGIVKGMETVKTSE